MSLEYTDVSERKKYSKTDGEMSKSYRSQLAWGSLWPNMGPLEYKKRLMTIMSYITRS